MVTSCCPWVPLQAASGSLRQMHGHPGAGQKEAERVRDLPFPEPAAHLHPQYVPSPAPSSAWAEFCSVNASLRYLHVNLHSACAPKEGFGDEEKEQSQWKCWGLGKSGLSRTADAAHVPPPSRGSHSHEVAELGDCSPLHPQGDGRCSCQEQPQAGQAASVTWVKDALILEEQHWQRQLSAGRWEPSMRDLLPCLCKSSQHLSGSVCFSLGI